MLAGHGAGGHYRLTSRQQHPPREPTIAAVRKIAEALEQAGWAAGAGNAV